MSRIVNGIELVWNRPGKVGVWMLVMVMMLLITSGGVAAHGEEDETAPVSRVLGEISFPTSATSAQAQEAFIRGMLLMHLFEYAFAREEFVLAQQIEPDFAMAYWGEAMTYNHPIWDEQDLEAARFALGRLGATSDQRLAATDAPIEKAFLQSLDALYGGGTKAERDRAYMQALERMAAQFPEDHEVQLFYALSLYGVQAGVRDIPTYMYSTAIAQSVFSANPHHPGAAHYLIHGVDDPDHAVLGLQAARALARMAPDAGHSLHMTSHIFTALGMWDDVVLANEAAIRVQNAMRVEQGLELRHWGHYNFWLLYGYLQQGRIEAARLLLTAAFQEEQENGKSPEDRMILDADRSLQGSVVQMWARYLVETQDWNGEVSQWRFNMGDAYDPNLTFTFIQAMRAVDEGQPSKASSYLDQFRKLKLELEQALRNKPESAAGDAVYLQRLAVLEQEMLAGIENARGETLAAATFAREASRLEGAMPFAFGPPFIDWPAAELLGDLLMKARKYADAAEAFEVQLKRARLRTRSLVGLVSAEERMDRPAAARYSLEKLAAIWQEADPGVKAVLETLLVSLAEETEEVAEVEVEGAVEEAAEDDSENEPEEALEEETDE